jgi:large subunit ribosomal protein L25
MPEFIEIDISKLEINDMVHVSDVKLVNAEVMEKAERFVIGVKTTRLAEVVEEVEEEEVEEGEEGAEGVAAEGAEGAPAEGTAKGGEGAKEAPAAGSDKK